MRPSSLRTAGYVLATGALALLLTTAGSETTYADSAKEAAVKTLMSQDLGGIAGKEAIMLTVEYPPGGSSPMHRHDADVFVYVLEGAVTMQVRGGEPVTLKPGQTFHEGPSDVHVKSANASTSEPAKFLVFMVKDKGKPPTRPAT